MYLHPSIEDCRYTLLQELFAWQAVVTSTERIQSTRYQVSLFLEVPDSLADFQLLYDKALIRIFW